MKPHDIQEVKNALVKLLYITVWKIWTHSW